MSETPTPKKDFLSVSVTPRGFCFIGFTDLYTSECSIQESSLAGIEAIWFGVDKDFETKQGSRMHLSREQVQELLPILEMFVYEGILPRDDEGLSLGNWRLCADELPTEADRYQCTFKPPQGERYVQDDYFDGSRFVHHDLIEAWRPRPEPYTPPEDERKKGNGEVCCKCGMVIKSYVYALCRDGKESLPHCGPCIDREIKKEARS